jgi:hypothetical protein
VTNRWHTELRINCRQHHRRKCSFARETTVSTRALIFSRNPNSREKIGQRLEAHGNGHGRFAHHRDSRIERYAADTTNRNVDRFTLHVCKPYQTARVGHQLREWYRWPGPQCDAGIAEWFVSACVTHADLEHRRFLRMGRHGCQRHAYDEQQTGASVEQVFFAGG